METYSRKGIFLDALADGEACNLEPVTREEVMLKRLVECGMGGSGGGAGGGDLVVNFTAGEWGNYTMDRDAIELIDAYHAGKNVVGFVQCKRSEYHMIKLFATNVREDETKYLLDFEAIRIDYSSSYEVLFYTLKVEVYYDTPESPQISFVVFKNSVQQV